MLTWKLGKKWIMFLLLLAAVASALVAQWGVATHPSFTFYLLPTRGFEILIGALISLHANCKNAAASASHPASECASLTGLALVLYSIFSVHENTPISQPVLAIANDRRRHHPCFFEPTKPCRKTAGQQVFRGNRLDQLQCILVASAIVCPCETEVHERARHVVAWNTGPPVDPAWVHQLEIHRNAIQDSAPRKPQKNIHSCCHRKCIIHGHWSLRVYCKRFSAEIACQFISIPVCNQRQEPQAIRVPLRSSSIYPASGFVHAGRRQKPARCAAWRFAC